ncbi:MAG: bifunctional diaminohydroxyphosphoribosylaminopyrimidine deaminase/5-amino-6-(5-phosphoribosylamino)uracil reductase RibD [bacterium]|nr:bifunctional diaminohydroxyphosphoribosylaminopyrimidine deaminase/5-amino-6-(5-phosphoribosylamino)uracil reductase RibD [bacterium]
MSKIHQKYMKRVLNLAKKGSGLTSPNPIVGAVIVKNNNIIGEGYHKKAGEEHAEINALRSSKESPKGAILYINLEPCDHVGKTPPCTQEIINSGIKEVIIAMVDPNPLVSGRGIKKLESYGIRVNVGVLEEKAKKLNEAYIYSITNKLPFVQLKMATSLNGKIYIPALKKDRYITGEKSRKEVHKLRSQVDAILIGKNTAAIDNSMLTNRFVKGKSPIRIVVDSKCSLDLNLNLFVNKDAETIIATSELADEKVISNFKERGIKVMVFPQKDEKVDLKELLKGFWQMGINNILVEGGALMATSFLQMELVNKIIFYISPIIVGQGLSFWTGKEELIVKIKNVEYKKTGEDIRIIGYLKV